jgi:hypothetical protein
MVRYFRPFALKRAKEKIPESADIFNIYCAGRKQ